MRSKTEMLTRADEAELFARIAAGGLAGRRAEERLVFAHRPLALRLVNNVARSGVPRDELEQQAMLGLVDTLRHFDTKRGVPFNAFAGRYVLHHLHVLCAQVSKPVNLPKTGSMKKVAMHYRRRRAAWEREHDDIWDRTGRVALAKALAVRVEDVCDYEHVHAHAAVSLDSYGASDDEDGSIEFSDGRDAEGDALHGMDLDRDVAWLRKGIALLSTTKRAVIERTISDQDTGEIAAALRLSRADVIDIAAAAREDLRHLIDDGQLPTGPDAPALAPAVARVVEQGSLFAGVEIAGGRHTETVMVVCERRRRTSAAQHHGPGSAAPAGRQGAAECGRKADQVRPEGRPRYSGLFPDWPIPWHRGEDAVGPSVPAPA